MPGKINKIQPALPGRVQNRPDRQNEVAPLMQQLDQTVKEGRLEEGQNLADKILRWLEN